MLYRAVAVSLMVSLLNACTVTPDKLLFSMPSTSTKAPESILVWPSPPETPRYSYLGDLRGESNKLPGDSKKQGSKMSRFLSALVGLGSETIPLTDILRPQHGVAAPDGKIYVADPGRQAVFIFDETASEFHLWNEQELGIPFSSPIGIALTENTVLVTDSEQGVVFELDLQGQLINTLGSGQLQRPTGIAYDPEQKHIFVSDTEDNSIKLLSRRGELIKVIGGSGTDPGQFNRPTYLQYINHKLYVSDSLNARIQILNELDDSIQVIGKRGLYIGNFSRPKGVAVDSDGNIYVTESYYDHLLIYNAEGEFLMAIGGSGSQPGQFSQPTGIWIDSHDRLFVSDMLNSRISIFQYLGDN